MKLEDVCLTITDGSHFSPSEQDVGYPMFSVKDMTDDGFDYSACKYISQADYNKLIKNGCKPLVNDVLLAKDGSYLKTAFVVNEDKEEVVLSSIAILRPDTSIIEPEYLKYFLKSEEVFRMVSLNYISGTALKRIILKGIKQIPICIPDLMVQRCRADLLNKTKEVIGKRKQQLEQLDLLIKARFVEMFGNGYDQKTETALLKDLCEFQQGTQVPVERQIEECKEGYVRFLRIIDYTQAPQEPRYVSVKGKEIDSSSVVVVRYGATAGFVGRGYEGILANNLFEVIPDEKILTRDFLFYALKYGPFEKEIHDKAFGAAMPALSFSMMNEISIVKPSKEMQKKFSEFYLQVDKSKVAVQKSLDEIQLLFDSLMQKYFG